MISNSALHYTIIKGIIDNGFAPDNKEIAKKLEVSEKEVIEGLYELQEYHGVVLHPNAPKVWVIHPFSLAPTNFYVQSDMGEWWGNCAWCSLGVAALVQENVKITTTIGGQTKQIEINIVDGQIVEQDLYIHFPISMKKAWDNVIYTCSNMLIFENDEQVNQWVKQHRIPKGDVQPIRNIWEFSKKWYGDHLRSDWKKWTMEEAKEMFAQYNLVHDIWNLEDEQGRF